MALLYLDILLDTEGYLKVIDEYVIFVSPLRSSGDI
jgi:hypothetical protein